MTNSTTETASTLDRPPARAGALPVPTPISPAYNSVAIDLAARQSEAFLTLLAEAEDVTFQTFADDKGRLGAGKQAQVLHGDLGRWGEYLHKLNADGAGVFVMVNPGDLRGRKAQNVTGIRALFVDLDGAPLAPVLNAGLEPHAVVESSPGRWHVYWLVADCPLEQFKPMQQALVAKFDGDPNVCDLPRVMRLPGFLHQKGEPFMTRLVTLNSRLPYALEEIRTTLDLQRLTSEPGPARAPVEPVEISDTLLADLRSALKKIPADEYPTWVRIGLALKTLGDAGFDVWWEWSQASKNHQPDVDRKTWRSLNPTRTSHKVVFAVAAEHGWVNPAKASAPAGNVIHLSEVERARRTLETYEALNTPIGEAPPPKPPEPLPAVGRCPANDFATLVAWIEQTYGLDERGATATAVMVAASLAARRYKERTDIYAVVCGANDARLLVERVTAAMLRGMGRGHLLREQRIGTVTALFEALKRMPSRLYLTTELSTQAETGRKQNTGSFDHLWAYMVEKLPNVPAIELDSAREANAKGNEPLTIHAPTLSLLAAVRDDRLEVLFNVRSPVHALVGSALWFDVADAKGEAQAAEPEEHAVASWITERAAMIAPDKVPGNLADCLRGSAAVEPVLLPGRDGVIAEDVLTVLDGGKLSDAGHRTARRLAFAVAAWESPHGPVVTREIAAWARALVERGAAELKAHITVQENDEGKRSVRAKVLEAIGKTRDKGLFKSNLPVEVRAYRDLKLDARVDIIEALEADKEIVRSVGPRGGTRLFLAKYAPAEPRPRAVGARE